MRHFVAGGCLGAAIALMMLGEPFWLIALVVVLLTVGIRLGETR